MDSETQDGHAPGADVPTADLPALAFTEPPPSARWEQLDIALTRNDGDARASARHLFARVLPWWLAERRAGRAGGLFFMRKPPDVRLRLQLTPAAQASFQDLRSELAQAVRAGELAGCEPGHYTPEDARFGGARSLAATHALFTLDTLLWARLAALDHAGLRRGDSDTLLLAVFGDLFARLGTRECGLAWAALGGEFPPALRVGKAAALRLPSLAALAADALLSTAERTIAAAYATAHAHYVAALTAVPPQGRTRAAVAATAAFFMFNRHGYPGTRAAPLVCGVLAGAVPDGA